MVLSNLGEVPRTADVILEFVGVKEKQWCSNGKGDEKESIA